jgi:arylsulfatase A-like enzyme
MQSRRQFLTTAAAAASLTAAPGKKWNLLIITNDQHRADCLGCYGNPVIKTPVVDRLANEGVRFENYFVHAPQCVPSRASLHTGRYPHVHRTPTNAYVLSDSEQTIARILNAQGYRTACVGEMPFAPRSYTGGFQQVLANNRDYDRFMASSFLPPEDVFRPPPCRGRTIWTKLLSSPDMLANF